MKALGRIERRLRLEMLEGRFCLAASVGWDGPVLHDSKNNDKFKAEPDQDYAKMYGGAVYNRVKFFDVVEAVSSGGSDLARIFDTTGNNTFEGQKDTSGDLDIAKIWNSSLADSIEATEDWLQLSRQDETLLLCATRTRQ